MIFRVVFLLPFVGVLLLCLSCDRNTPSAAPAAQSVSKPDANASSYRVVEHFNVGENVVVRGLALAPDESRLWVGTSVGALEIELPSGQLLNTFTRDNGLANEYVFAAMVDHQGRAWLGTNGGGVSLRTGDEWKTFFPMHGLADYWVYSFTEQRDGTVWVGTWAGLSRFKGESFEITNYVRELVNEWVYGLAVDSRDRVWVGTEGGVNMFDGQSWRVWTHEDGLGAPNAANLPFSANTGLGTRSRHDLSVLIEGRETYNPNYVFCLGVDANDAVWAGTWGGGTARFDGKTWQNFTDKDGLAGNIVYSLSVSPNDGIWFGTNNGLSQYHGGLWRSYGLTDGLLDKHVYAVSVTSRGEVWAGTRNGVVKLAKN